LARQRTPRSKKCDFCFAGPEKAIFANPVSSSIAWSDISALLTAAGARKVEGEGSRVKFIAGDMIWSTHKPHPGKEAKAYQVSSVRDFLIQLGVTP
jgi:hypothetical protein